VRILASFALFATCLAGCSRDSSAPTQASSNYSAIGGSYNGQILGSSQAYALASTLGFTFVQTGGTFSGSWTLNGTLFTGQVSSAAAVTGTFTGTMTAGADPGLSLTIKVPACPDFQAQFTGSYAPATRQVTLTGPMVVFANGNCSTALTFQTTVTLHQ
jgi:hypothetical protein